MKTNTEVKAKLKMKLFQYTPLQKLRGWKPAMGEFGWLGGELFISAGAAGMSDHEAVICLGYDGTPAWTTGRSVLLPESWARREKPDRKELFDAIRSRAVEALERDHEA